MKKLLLVICIITNALALNAQTDGITYQAVIIDPNPQELPGVDAQGNILPNAVVALRFTILDANNLEEYQEVQITNTDPFGMINVIIGHGEPTNLGTGDFTMISWDGTAKSLRVDIDFAGGDSFVDMSRQELTFVPYAFHRNITATGTLTVDDLTFLNGELQVQGPTNLNSSLDVNNQNATNLSGSLTVEGHTELRDGLTVIGVTNLDSLDISGTLTVEGKSTFNGPAEFNAPTVFKELEVDGPSDLLGQVTIRVDSMGGQDQYTAYPLLVEGSAQGIAIKVSGIDNDNPLLFTDVPLSTENNFISFWNDDETMWGRIEGQSNKDLASDPEHIWELGNRSADVIINSAELGVFIAELFQKTTIKLPSTFTSSTACAGIGACVTAPIPSLIVEASSDVILKIANAAVALANLGLAISEVASYETFKKVNLGVSYQSGAGDYAEWLPKLNLAETFIAGELVGIENGMVTKNTWGVEKIMIVSTSPIVLGNMPQQNDEVNNVKIAFMGQVPVRVVGKVAPGDYILPDGLGSGFAKAVHPSDMQTRDYKKVAGVAWSVIGMVTKNISIVNVAVGINTNDLSDVVYKQEEQLAALRKEYEQLKSQTEKSNAVLATLVPGYAEAIVFSGESNFLNGTPTKELKNQTYTEEHIAYNDEDDILYFQISAEQIETAIELAREMYQNMGNEAEQTKHILMQNDVKRAGKLSINKNLQSDNSLDNLATVHIEDHPFWQRLDSDPEYKEEIIQFMKSGLEKGLHTHKKHAHKFTGLELKK